MAMIGGTDNKAIRELRDSVKDLSTTIKAFNKETSRQTEKMLFLTYTIAFLTVIMVIGLIIQIIFK